MLNKRIFFTLVGSVTISGFIVICTLGQSLYRQKVEAKNADVVSELEQVKCIVREYNGNLGIFRGNSLTPYKIIECDVSLLSDYDREQLSDGITMDSEEDLRIFIEDMVT